MEESALSAPPAQTAPSNFPRLPSHLYGLGDGEMFWVDHRDWLKTKGYLLRERYQAGWVHSWKGTGRYSGAFEDAQTHPRDTVMDATRLDGKYVMLKSVNKSRYPDEVEIVTWLNAEPRRSDPNNYTVPIYEVLQSPLEQNIEIIVMPLLQRYPKPRFDTVGEAIAFLRQVFEGLRYLHKQNVAHRDITSFNIAMMDGSQLSSEPFHPAEPTMKRDWSGHISNKTRTQVPVKYYLIDFGLSRRFNSEDFPVRVTGTVAAYDSVPEYQLKNGELPPPSDPFLVDVYCMGNLIRVDFTEGSVVASRKLGFEFLEPLVADMTNENPSERPNMDQVIDRFEHLVRGLSSRKSRSRVVKEKDHFGFFRAIPHCIRKARLVVGGYPAIPMP
ncbi:kinase-like domain-containing protein [Mycena filopes]|nr:kinase-like domain-containing protein [Mycena filopes]